MFCIWKYIWFFLHRYIECRYSILNDNYIANYIFYLSLHRKPLMWLWFGHFSCTSPQGETSDRWSCMGSLPARWDSRQASPHPFWSAHSSWCSPCRMFHPLLMLSCYSVEKNDKRMWNPWIQEWAVAELKRLWLSNDLTCRCTAWRDSGRCGTDVSSLSPR